MDGDRLKAVKQGLQTASSEINAGNYVGLITFGDRPKSLIPLAPFDTLQHQRLLAAIDALTADGSTAMYDGMMVGLAELMERKKTDPNGRFYLLLLSDGEANQGLNFEQVKDIVKYSGVRVYPIAYGEVNQQELQATASLRESTVQAGNPKNVQRLLKELFQTNL
jgi:Ca-activated chloride channel family protein